MSKGKQSTKQPAPQAAGKAKGKGEAEAGPKAPAGVAKQAPRAEPPRLKVRYREEIAPRLMEQFGYKNPNCVPRLVKVVVNMGVGQAIQDPKILDGAVADMTVITGQKPVVTVARKSISNFKVRAGMRVGCRVTLRGDRMYDFLDKLFHVALPRVRDFGGVPPDSFDGRGNFAMGLREQLVFPEIDYDKIDRIRGLNVAVVTTAKTDEEGRALLKALGCPFREV
ncbi:MAG: 50S ribosomal protein L5 [Armatimonadota bacterium]|jgi:large subunit ribosomal protein L5|nr:MAG: 50S ribosomal protein L5 [Armatimonadota bacterium]